MFTILVTFLTVIADQITKYFVCINMDLGETIPVIKNVVHLTYIINPGAAFGLFPHQDVLFLGIVMILLLAFAWLRNRIPQSGIFSFIYWVITWRSGGKCLGSVQNRRGC